MSLVKDSKRFCFYHFVLTIVAGLVFSSLVGCLVRTYPKVIERVDLDIEGNQGYLLGSPPSGQIKEQKTTRTVQVFEIEVGPPVKILKEEPQTETAPTQLRLPASKSQKIEKTVKFMEEIEDIETLPAEAQLEETSKPTTYVVQKGDTLQKISNRPEIYGTYKKWRRIYEANKDKLTSPDKIKPGQVLIIPRD